MEFCRFLLPCFVPGCHAFGLKIATAAERPRNDTQLERFNLENGRFSIFAVIFCVLTLCIVFQTIRSGNCYDFPQNLPNLSLRGGRVRPTRQSLTERDGIPERSAAGLRSEICASSKRKMLTHVKCGLGEAGLRNDIQLRCMIYAAAYDIRPRGRMI